jgi:uncharacterized membrane protein HdeD (DUF308 family)
MWSEEADMADSTSMPMCPMAGMCKRMVEKPGTGLVLLVPGVLLIVLGVVILVEPRVLIWLVALALVLMGIALLTLARMMRRFGAQHLAR